MTVFLRHLEAADKSSVLLESAANLRTGVSPSAYIFDPQNFRRIPGAPFAYWASDRALECFGTFSSFESNGRDAKQGLATADDFRFVRLWWECSAGQNRWSLFAKGGSFSPYYADVYLCINCGLDTYELAAFSGSVIRNPAYYFRPGLTWPRRTQSGLGMRVLPAGCVFADKGPSAFVDDDDPEKLLALLSFTVSRPFRALVELQMCFGSYEVGVIQRTPIPEIEGDCQQQLASLAKEAWSLTRLLDTASETSHAFRLPMALEQCTGNHSPSSRWNRLREIQSEIDEIVLSLYGFDEFDRMGSMGENNLEGVDSTDDPPQDPVAIRSWSVGVAFGRFDWRLPTCERVAPLEPEPFDPLPDLSPGMLPEDDTPFHSNPGILVDDPGHEHDLVRVMESVSEAAQSEGTADLRPWLRKDFFPYHLKQYSKSRRKAPIYWPLSASSVEYTLWLYYPELNGQTLYTAVNDFVEPKLNSVSHSIDSLQTHSSRSRAEENELEKLTDLSQELADLRDTLLDIAKNYRPHRDDGVQITAAPLWPLFRHKPWQKVLKETWAKLEAGDYDWAHLAMAYWPNRVVRTAHRDRSIAIAHELEDDLWHEVEVGRSKGKPKYKWQPRDLSEQQLDAIAARFK